MDTLSDMKLDKKKQISYRSTDDIVSKLDLAAARLAAAKVSFGGAKLRTGHLVNAVALWLGELSTEDLAMFAGPKLAALEAYLGRDEDDDPPPPSVDAPSGRHPIPIRPGREIKPGGHDLSVAAKHGRPARKK